LKLLINKSDTNIHTKISFHGKAENSSLTRYLIKVLLEESKHDNSTNESPRAKRHFASVKTKKQRSGKSTAKKELPVRS
jgi:hypothetical protein